MTQSREPFKFGQDANERSMNANKEMLEYLLEMLPETHYSRPAIVQDLENLKHQLDEAKKNARNNQPGN